MGSWGMWRVALLALGVAAAMAAGTGIGYAVAQPALGRTDGRLGESLDQVRELQERLDDRAARVEELLGRVAGLGEGLAVATAQAEALEGLVARQEAAARDLAAKRLAAETALALDAAEIAALESRVAALERESQALADLRATVAGMEADRLLLVELRKETPSTEEEATTYWKRVRDLATGSDPSLGPRVTRVIRQLPTYFAWADAPYGSNCEALEAYFDSGASELGTMQGDLQRDVFLVLINRMDAALGRTD